VPVLTRVAQAAVTPTAGTVVLIGSGTEGSADSRLVTVEVTPPAVTEVARFSVAAPLHVTVPVTVTPDVPALTWTFPVHEADGSAVTPGRAAAAGAAPNAAVAAIRDTTTSGRADLRVISCAFQTAINGP
jgi:hypothetical protein